MIKVCSARYNHNVEEISLTSIQLDWCNTEFKKRFKNGAWQIAPLKVEASHRHFYRATPQSPSDRPLVLMASPPTLERNDQFVALQSVFSAHHIPVPQIQAQDRELGLFLLSDLGQQDLEACYATPLKDEAIQCAIKMLHIIDPVRDPALDDYDESRLRMELGLFDDWFVSGLLAQSDLKLPADALDRLVSAILVQPKSCVHRDYHCRNLLYQNDTLGIVDFQDALIGAALYDLASLLHDCYYEFSSAEIDRWLDFYLQDSAHFQHLDPKEVRALLDFTAIQRQLKAIGIFARLQLRDQKSSHLTHIQPLLHRLINLLTRYPELEPLKMQLINCIKPAARVLSR